jgi:hypothetical protein
MRILLPAALAAGLLWLVPASALAGDEDAELWFNPSATRAISDRTEFELETAQRLRSDPRNDTYFVRAWVNHKDSRGTKWSAGLEQRWNGPVEREVRMLQQVGYSWGALDFRTRLEQRFVTDTSRTGVRVRQRVGSSVPVGGDGWSLAGDAEFFVTVRATDPDGQTGLTGLRTFVGFEREVGRYELSLGYLRQQDIRDGRPDRIGHAPFIGINAAF